MPKLLIVVMLCLVIVGVFVFSTNSNFNEFVIKQVATVIGIDIRKVYDYQLRKGIRRDLAVGDTGKEVKLVQVALHSLRPDFPKENITGYFGERTSRAISEYQKEQGLLITGKLDAATRNKLNAVYFNELCPQGKGNIFSDDILIKVNRENSLPEDYIPGDLVDISKFVKTTSLVCLRQDVVPYLKSMMDDASSENIQLVITSGFRRHEIQSLIYKIWVSIQGEEATKKEVAEPLHSEHQLGTAVDITGATNNYIGADPAFHGTPEDIWLKKNAHKYGFVMSYPENKSSITGYIYEPWHYRFVGIDVAKIIYKKKISVEEHFQAFE